MLFLLTLYIFRILRGFEQNMLSLFRFYCRGIFVWRERCVVQHSPPFLDVLRSLKAGRLTTTASSIMILLEDIVQWFNFWETRLHKMDGCRLFGYQLQQRKNLALLTAPDRKSTAWIQKDPANREEFHFNWIYSSSATCGPLWIWATTR